MRLSVKVALETVDPAGTLARSNFITMALAGFASGQVYRLSVAPAALFCASIFRYVSAVGWITDESCAGGGSTGGVYTTVREGRLLVTGSSLLLNVRYRSRSVE